MIAPGGMPDWVEVLTGLLVLAGAAITLTGAIGLVRFKNFYQRLHAPTLGTTLGTVLILLGSMLYFTVLQTRPVLHEVLIIAFVTLTTPVTLMLLARAALYRDRIEGSAEVPADVPIARPDTPAEKLDEPERSS
jgi:multicomponent K+:H+ antiporter subunit G